MLARRSSNSKIENLLTNLTSRKDLPDEINCALIVLDLETNKLGKDAEIVQLAAIDCHFPNEFYSFHCVPSFMDMKASQVNGLFLKIDEQGQLPVLTNNEGNEIPTLSLEEGLSGFIKFLRKRNSAYNRDSSTGPIIVAHNGFRFDFPLLMNHLRITNLALPTTTFFADSFIGVRKLANKEPVDHLPDSSSLKNLVSHLQPDCEYTAHDALGDCHALRSILLPFTNQQTGNASKMFIFDSCDHFLRYGLATNVEDFASILDQI